MGVSQQALAFHLGELVSGLRLDNYYGNGYLKLEIYFTVILQLANISLLLSLSSSVVAVLPAIPSFLISNGMEAGIVTKPIPKEVKAEDYQPIADSKNIEKFVNDYFADIPILAKIAKCESRYRHLDSYGNVLKGDKNSYDRGVMQINILYHAKDAKELGLDVHSLDDNVKYARYLYERDGARPWMSSSACWAEFNQSEIAKR